MIALLWTPEAIDDREQIYSYIEADKPLAALALDELFDEQAALLRAHPHIGKPGRVAEVENFFDASPNQLELHR